MSMKKAIVYNIMFEGKYKALEKEFMLVDLKLSESEFKSMSKNNLDFVVGYELGNSLQNEEELLYFDYEIID